MIGEWVGRYRDGRLASKYHLVELVHVRCYQCDRGR